VRRLLPLLVLAVAGCSFVPAATTPRATAGPDVPALAYYDAPGPVPRPTRVERVRRESQSESWRVELPPRVPAELADVPRVHDGIDVRIFLPRPAGPTRRPLVVMLPILSNRMLLMREAARGFVRQGYVVAVVLRKDVEFDVDRSIRQAEKELRIMIMRVRQAIDWLVRQPQIDGERIGVFGMSAGGILGASLMGADPRIDAGVFVFAGGPMADVMVDTVEEKLAKKTERMRRERGWDKERVRRTLRGIIRTDPILLAPRIRREDVLLFIATDDRSVPTRNQRLLWDALGRPAKYELRAGHYTGVALYLPFLMRKAQGFMGRKLGSP